MSMVCIVSLTTVKGSVQQGVDIRIRPRFFDQVGHETMYASSGNKHFFTKSCHHQTYQNYEQRRQKLGTYLENKIPQKLDFSKKNLDKSWSPSLIFFIEKKIHKDSVDF